MYRLFELFGTNWIDAVDVKTLEEVKDRLQEESKKEGLNQFRIDNGDIPLTFCGTSEQEINYCIEYLEKIEQAVMYMHGGHQESCQKVESTRPSKFKKEIKIPKKTTKKHIKKIIRSNQRKKRYYG